MKPALLLTAGGLCLALSGCKMWPVQAAQTADPTPDPHRYVMHGSPDKGEFLVDGVTGKVWKYDGDSFKPIVVGEIEEWVRGSDGKLHKSN